MISLVLGFANPLHTDEDRSLAVDLDSLVGVGLGIALVVRDSEATIPAAVAVVLAVAPLAVPGVRTAADDGNHLAAAATSAVLA